MMGIDEDDLQGRNLGSSETLHSVVLDQSPLGYRNVADSSGLMFGSALDASAVAEEDDPLAASSQPFGKAPARPGPGQRGGPPAASRGGSGSNAFRAAAMPGLTSFADLEDSSLVEPPSYADAMLSASSLRGGPGESPSAAAGGSRGAGGSGRPGYMAGAGPVDNGGVGALRGNETLRISVSDAQKIVPENSTAIVGSGAYVTYKVTTQTTLPGFSAPRVEVRRRFRDFVALADRLAEVYKGYFIPPRPDKSLMESQVMQQGEFIETRRLQLEKYLRRLAAHPDLRLSEDLRLFLESNDRLPAASGQDLTTRMLDGAAKLPRQLFGSESVAASSYHQEAAQPAKQGKDFLRIFKELKQSVTTDWVGAAKPAVVEEDKEYLERRDKMLELEKVLGESSQHAEQLVKAQQEIADVLGELGMTFVRLAKYESEGKAPEQKALAAQADQFGRSAVVRMSRIARAGEKDAVAHLMQLHEYMGLMQAGHVAFSDRSAALLSLQTLMGEVEAKTVKVDKLKAASSKVLGGDFRRTKQISDVEKELESLSVARDEAKLEYERVKERNRLEMERFERERRADFLMMLEGFVRSQISCAEKGVEIWGAQQELLQSAGADALAGLGGHKLAGGRDSPLPPSSSPN